MTTYTPLNNITEKKEVRRQLRNQMTAAELRLWVALKSSQLEGRKFRRQHSVGPYILDFYCPSERLAIELDGEHHFTESGQEHDKEREQFLSTHTIRVLRFENKWVFSDISSVLTTIKQAFRTEWK